MRECESVRIVELRNCGVLRWGAAIAGALLVHVLLAAAIVWYVECAPGPTVMAELDLSSVELSFSDEKTESETVAPALPAAARHEVAAPKQEECPSEFRREKPLPPEPGAYKFPEPKEEVRPIETEKDLRRETLDEEPEASDAKPQVAAPAQARVDAPPRPKRAIKPEYPKGARQRGEQGNVVLEIEIGADGVCVAARVAVSCGFAELDAAAVKAALAARFVPAKAGERSVASAARLTLSFRLKQAY